MNLICMQPQIPETALHRATLPHIKDTLEIKTKLSSEEGILFFFLVYMFLFPLWVWVNKRQYKNLWAPLTFE